MGRIIAPLKKFGYTSLNQAAAVQNTWYTVLDTMLLVEIIEIAASCTVANETVEIRITLDGVTYTLSSNFTAGTVYYIYPNAATMAPTTATIINAFATQPRGSARFNALSIKIEMRKTTNAGASALQATVTYNKQVE